MSPGRKDPNINVKILAEELTAFENFIAGYAPACGKGDLVRLAIQKLVRAHGFPFPDLKDLENTTQDYPLDRKKNAPPLAEVKTKRR